MCFIIIIIIIIIIIVVIKDMYCFREWYVK